MSENNNSKQRFEWFWQSNSDPWEDSDSSKWTPYSDIENVIIEEAFAANQSVIALDGYYIDFESELQISTYDINKQRPVKRIIRSHRLQHYREGRFITDPIAPKCTVNFHLTYNVVSPLILEVKRYLNLKPDQYPSKDKAIVSVIVEKAAAGIVEEGNSMGMRHEALKIAEMLLKTKNEDFNVVWKCCAYLYSMESFLYKKMNSAMKQIGCESHEPVWHLKTTTLGPFSFLLWDVPSSSTTETNKILYRPGKLTNEQIDTYKKMMNDLQEHRSFQAFTSCSRTPTILNLFPDANVLFIISLSSALSIDIKSVSLYPEEEEELITPGVYFTVENVQYDTQKNKYIIDLKLKEDNISTYNCLFVYDCPCDLLDRCSHT